MDVRREWCTSETRIEGDLIEEIAARSVEVSGAVRPSLVSVVRILSQGRRKAEEQGEEFAVLCKHFVH